MSNANKFRKKKRLRKKQIRNLIYAVCIVILIVFYLKNPDQSPLSQNPGQENVQQFSFAGNSGSQYDDAGNPADTSDYLTSIKSYKDVMPKGFSFSSVPTYNGKKYFTVNNNVPFFTENEIALAEQAVYFEYYGDLDSLGRCTLAFDCLGRETMPGDGEKRGDISAIHPTGWHQARYDCVDSETVLTRAHLAGFMMSAENANSKNLITGTRYMNSDSMLEFEKKASNYIRNKNRHVLYRVTPVFSGDDLMASGVLMEARSVEDKGWGVQYCVFIYNVQPGLKINYATGRSLYTGIFYDINSQTVITDDIKLGKYVMDLSSNTIHTPGCSKLNDLNSSIKSEFYGDTEMEKSWAEMGYNICSICLD